MSARLALRPSFAPLRLALAAATLGVAALALDVRAVAPALPEPGEAAPASGRAIFPGPYEARVLRVVDGDTFVARLSVWFGQEVETLVRLRGIDAPERAARCGAEAEGAERAARALADLLAAGRVSLRNVAGDKYFGRVVADAVVSAADGDFPPTEVGPALIAQGVARAYDGRARATWSALREARARP